ncbi:NAD-dependent epimerase/dehydratase family protein [Burkholderia stabilis]|uniref:NAD-dependent epimerase/dehydratase family protein n=1 Tax=Burkholderia stabilis TaxID=95485 RepID=UPI0012EA152E|nr:NAD-dependent epimerase/dehydratase family protein [Burkholderia stabilis]HDR9492540.1 NAD-dependent epimerase/dehydratase family protein [Burkholderia stabilis]HDR9523060.1 NAD-dependent epimerase/dehydratase family protein [Burkholderia stabilis]HDR9530354.1 NAD-dependent epimerase/dehydratase family protein [Burkholderia stabilis]HDR9539311.1 NAD-dependent epimerase/dehydratase family protein [Burkholderia stabilis]HDR9548197.1 NAD-dependent epimerase/dehydratase family protein [Burkhold
MMRVLVSGANGFVGRVVCAAAVARGHDVTALVRRPGLSIPGVREWVSPEPDFVSVGDAWAAGEIDAVVHTAARVHQFGRHEAQLLDAYRRTNVDGTLRLAEAAYRHGCHRFVSMSSVKALAERDAGRPLRETDTPRPLDAYGISKRETEEALVSLAARFRQQGISVRCPLVYGPGVAGNFERLMSAVARRTPLPLGRASAPRSLVFVGNLADALLALAEHTGVCQSVYHVADRETLTVRELVEALGRHLGQPARLIDIPVGLLQLAARVTGRTETVRRLVDPLRLDTGAIQHDLGWQPPFSCEEGLAETARARREHREEGR